MGLGHSLTMKVDSSQLITSRKKNGNLVSSAKSSKSANSATVGILWESMAATCKTSIFVRAGSSSSAIPILFRGVLTATKNDQ
jgi:hypothetical protein